MLAVEVTGAGSEDGTVTGREVLKYIFVSIIISSINAIIKSSTTTSTFKSKWRHCSE